MNKIPIELEYSDYFKFLTSFGLLLIILSIGIVIYEFNKNESFSHIIEEETTAFYVKSTELNEAIGSLTYRINSSSKRSMEIAEFLNKTPLTPFGQQIYMSNLNEYYNIQDDINKYFDQFSETSKEFIKLNEYISKSSSNKLQTLKYMKIEFFTAMILAFFIFNIGTFTFFNGLYSWRKRENEVYKIKLEILKNQNK